MSIAFFSQNGRLAQLLTSQLSERIQFETCASYDDMHEALSGGGTECLVADFAQASSGGHAEVQLLESVQGEFPDTDIVMITSADCPEPLERRATCTGITHLRDVGARELVDLIEARCLPGEDQQVVDGGTDNPAKPVTIVERFATHSRNLRTMLEELDVAARHDVIILLIGETGSGKTFLSRQIHEVSPRREQPFLHLACGALPVELIESELFGHVKGAFTGAHADKEGKFVAAGSGTILLDEIDALGPDQQMKLLRVIETGEFEPVGSNKTLTSRARLVVASNRELEPLVELGRFRPDLYYRLNMLKFELPPLRERMGDVDSLVQQFVQRFSEKHGADIRQLDPNLYETLARYSWPGNVRELENVIQRAVIYAQDGVLSASQLPPQIRTATLGQGETGSAAAAAQDEDDSLGSRMADTEKDLIQQALKRNNFSRTRTSRELGISRVTLYNKMKKYGMLG